MLLIEVTINSTLHRVSVEGHALDHYWDPMVVGFDPPTYATDHPWGGYCSPKYGSISFSPELFESDWPPPISVSIAVKYSSSDETSAETLFTGTGHLKRIDLDQVQYEIFGPQYTTETASATAFNDTLNNVAAYFCGASHLNLPLDTSKARATSPNVKFTTDRDWLDIQLFSEVAAFYSHLFYIEDGTLYLVDMKLDNGSRNITEYDFFRGSYYTYQSPVAMIQATDSSGTVVGQKTSSYPYGKEMTLTAYHDTQANVENCLDDILAIIHKLRARLKMPLEGDYPKPGEAINFTDASLQTSTDFSIRARYLQYAFFRQGGELVLEGEGTVS